VVPLNVGEALGAYRLVAFLGEGSLASVYKAYHAALDRHVTLKVLKPDYYADPAVRLRFQQEARLSARLDHPNIVPVHDFVVQGDLLYLVSKHIEGETLAARIARGPLSPADCGRMLGAVGAALQHAHGHSILHGDLKPANTLLAADGNVYLTDFGVARVVTGDLAPGSPAYISPEQARGSAEVDARADQYALGVVLFESLTGVLPFRAATARELIHQHQTALPPRPSALNPALGREVEDVILTALSKEPRQRYPDVQALVAAFQKSIAPPRPPTAPLRAGGENVVSGKLPFTADLPVIVTPAGPSISIMLTTVTGQVFRLANKPEYYVGRSEPTRSFKPDVDLAALRGMELGVSRRHGRLHVDSGTLYYTDLKSTNGSRVNGARLYAEIPQTLEDGDELCVGSIVFRVYFGT
jgi:serine/threonine-protein kinase